MINNAFTAVGVGIASQVSNLGGMKNEPDDKFRLNNDGSVTLLQRTNKKSHEFYNTQGQYLFEISEKLEPRKDWSNLSGDFQKEIAWSIAKVGLQVNVNDNLASYMKVRAEEVGWDAMPGLNMLDKLGHHNRNMLGVDALVSFTRIPYNQSTREGKPSSLIGLIPYIKTIDAFYPFLNSGRDLQYDIIHPKSLIDATYSIEGTSIWERIKEIYQQGLNNTLYKLNHMYYYNK
ncbi:hypothetical protein GCM10023143_25280 [Compostibacter hankyongensis]|uniref:Uncharacterized protein n=2 Tax=Compostibacter hankyongensis TaxID=1007089 RepID=A0ABP8FZV0_9BACT